jgi:hypothetical protein
LVQLLERGDSGAAQFGAISAVNEPAEQAWETRRPQLLR